MLVKYLMRTTVTGGILGAVHGVATLHQGSLDSETRMLHIAAHAQTGAVIGPWMPILVPIWLVLDESSNKTACPIMKGGMPFLHQMSKGPGGPPDLPTVAEKP